MVDAGPVAEAAGGGVADVVFDGVGVVGGELFGEGLGGAVVVVAGGVHGVDGDDARGVELGEGGEEGEGFGFGGVGRAAVVLGGGAALGPVFGGEVAVDVDAILVGAGLEGKAVGVGDGADGDAGVGSEGVGVLAEVVEEALGDGGAGGLVAVDGAEDEGGVWGVAEEVEGDGAALDGVA